MHLNFDINISYLIEVIWATPYEFHTTPVESKNEVNIIVYFVIALTIPIGALV